MRGMNTSLKRLRHRIARWGHQARGQKRCNGVRDLPLEVLLRSRNDRRDLRVDGKRFHQVQDLSARLLGQEKCKKKADR